MSRLLGFFTVLFFGAFILLGSSDASAGLPSPQAPSGYQAPVPQSYQPQLGSNVTPNLGVLTQGILIETLAALSCQLAGIDPLDPYGRCIGVDPTTRQLTRAEKAGGGAIAFVSRGISGTYSIPVSSTQYISYLRSNFGITKSAYAQKQEASYGFRALYPILEIWRTFRNLVFLFFVLIFSAIGIGIMFRLHIDARAVMTVQNQIPKLVIGLILISFSFAIAGLMIDFMYVLIYLFFNVAAQIYDSIGIGPVNFPGLNSNTFGFVNTLYSPNHDFGIANLTFIGRAIQGVMNSGIMSVTMGASLSVGEIVGSIFEGILDSTIGSLFSLLMSPLSIAMGPFSAACSIVDHIPSLSDIPGLGVINKIPLVGSIPGIGGGGPECGVTDLIRDLPKLIIQSITSLLAFIVILIAILFSLFRLWFTLIKAYLFILLDIVFAPFWIAAGLLPKGGLGWWAWFRSLMANLSVFPVTIGVLLIGKLFMDSFGSGAGDYFVPPLIGDVNDPNEIGMLIGLGMILLTPQLIDTVKNALKTKAPNFPAISAAVGMGRGVTTGFTGQVKDKLYHRNHTTGELEGPIGEAAMNWSHKNRVGQFLFRTKHYYETKEGRERKEELEAGKLTIWGRHKDEKKTSTAAKPHEGETDKSGAHTTDAASTTLPHASVDTGAGGTGDGDDDPNPDGDPSGGGTGGGGGGSPMSGGGGAVTTATPPIGTTPPSPSGPPAGSSGATSLISDSAIASADPEPTKDHENDASEKAGGEEESSTGKGRSIPWKGIGKHVAINTTIGPGYYLGKGFLGATRNAVGKVRDIRNNNDSGDEDRLRDAA